MSQHRFSLKAKLTALVVGAVLLMAAVLGSYFFYVVNHNARDVARRQINHGFERLGSGLLRIETQLVEGLRFVQGDEKFIASVELIDDYQDKAAYNAILVDEEKKLIADALLARAKLSFNNDAILYDKHGELVAYAAKNGKGYLQGYLSFDHGQASIHQRREDEADYTPLTPTESARIGQQHQFLDAAERTVGNPFLTYQRSGERVDIKSHLRLTRGAGQEALGYIEMTHALDGEFFRRFSEEIGFRMYASADPRHADIAQPISALDSRGARGVLREAPVRAEGDALVSALSKPLTVGDVYFVAELPNAALGALLQRSRLELTVLLAAAVLATLLLARLVVSRMLERPLDSLRLSLEKIQRQDYSASPVIATGDDLEDVSRTINLMSEAVNQREQELQRHRDQLEQLVAQRTAQLSSALEQAQEASVAKSAFLANMSHEIRTPMNGILGMAHLMRRAGVSPTQLDRLDKIEAAGRHLLAIINDILDLSKIGAGKMAIEAIPVQPEAIFKNVAAMLIDRLDAKHLRLDIDVAPMPAGLLGDPTRLQQALLNYAGNAVKFTDAGTVTLRAVVVDENDASALLRFEVSDTGPGISAEALQRLFGAFEQADNSITRKHGGTGLGLAITRRLAELMGGEAGVSSTPGLGSTFWLTARLVKAAVSVANTVDGAQASAGEREGAELVLRHNHAGTRILLVEDDPVNAEVALAMLEDAGLSVEIAGDGAEAVERVRTGAYALVLMDMQMPRMDGLEATRRIRTLAGQEGLSGLANLPVIAMTANAFADDRARCREAGMDDYIVKPVMPAVLYSTVLRWLTRSSPDVPVAPEAPAALEPTPEPTQPCDLIQQIPGLDWDTGLQRLNYKKTSYVRLLKLFCTAHADDAGTLRKAMALGQWDEAIFCAHTLKGAAGTLGIVPVQTLAVSIEQALQGGRGNASALQATAIPQLAEALRTFARAIDDLPTPILWQAHFNIGHALIDSQHRALLALCNRLADCICNDGAARPEQFSEILSELATYAQEHFATEEELLAACNYPGLEAQRREHMDYEERVAQMLSADVLGQRSIIGVQRFLTHWWCEHILTSDMQYKDYVR